MSHNYLLYIKVFHGVLVAKVKIRCVKYNQDEKFGQSDPKDNGQWLKVYLVIKACSSGIDFKGWYFNNLNSDLDEDSPSQVLVLFQIGNHG